MPTSPGRRVAAAALLAYAVLCAALLVARACRWDGFAEVSQWFAMPLLVVVLAGVTGLASRLSRWSAAGLGFSWLGDVLPDFVPDDLGFIALMLSFLVAHAAYITGFWPYRQSWRASLPWMVSYGAAAVVMIAVVAPGAGPLTPAVAVYAAALATVAVLVTGLGRVGAVGGLLFVLSDSLIAGGEFVDGFALPMHQFWVMAPYLLAQALIVIAVLRQLRPARSFHAPTT